MHQGDPADEILIIFMKKLDLPSRLKLRLNKRLDNLLLSIGNNLKEIHLKINSNGWNMTVNDTIHSQHYESRNLNRLEAGLCGLAYNTSIDKLFIVTNNTSNEQTTRIISSLFNFNTDFMSFENNQWLNMMGFPIVNHDAPLAISTNVICFSTNMTCTSLIAQDLCTLQEAMLDDDCKLKTFCVRVDDETRDSFVEQCFGIIINDVDTPIPGSTNTLLARCFSTEDESLELYGSVFHEVFFFIGDLWILASYRSITFRRGDHGMIPDIKQKIQLNNFYVDE